MTAERFETLVKGAFIRRPWMWLLSKIPVVSALAYLLQSLFSDGLYLTSTIEKAYKIAFGSAKSIQDFSYASTIGTKIALMAATVQKRPSTQLFTNYNGISGTANSQGKCRLQTRDF